MRSEPSSRRADIPLEAGGQELSALMSGMKEILSEDRGKYLGPDGERNRQPPSLGQRFFDAVQANGINRQLRKIESQF